MRGGLYTTNQINSATIYEHSYRSAFGTNRSFPGVCEIRNPQPFIRLIQIAQVFVLHRRSLVATFI
jgi:hypothetical protein